MAENDRREDKKAKRDWRTLPMSELAKLSPEESLELAQEASRYLVETYDEWRREMEYNLARMRGTA